MVEGIFKIAGPIIAWLFKSYVNKTVKNEAKRANFNEWMASIDTEVDLDVANYLAATEARQATLDRIRKRREAKKSEEPSHG